jgi:hypothetical protein
LLRRYRWVSIRSCPSRRLAIEANNYTVVWVDNERVGGASRSVPGVVYLVPLLVDVGRFGVVTLMSDTDEVVLPAFVFSRVLSMKSVTNPDTVHWAEILHR